MKKRSRAYMRRQNMLSPVEKEAVKLIRAMALESNKQGEKYYSVEVTHDYSGRFRFRVYMNNHGFSSHCVNAEQVMQHFEPKPLPFV